MKYGIRKTAKRHFYLFISDIIRNCVKCKREMEASEEPAELCEQCVMEDQKLRVICIESQLQILIIV